MRWVFPKQIVLLIRLLSHLFRKPGIPVPEPGECDAGNSRLELSPLGTNFLKGTGFAFCDFAFELGQHGNATTSRRKVSLDLFIPSSFFQLLEPVSELFTIGFG